MVMMLCRNRVEDFSNWKRIFDSQASACRDAGLRLRNLWRDVEDPNNVFFLFDVASLDKAREFISSPTAAEIGKSSGVIDGECHFIESSTGY